MGNCLNLSSLTSRFGCLESSLALNQMRCKDGVYQRRFTETRLAYFRKQAHLVYSILLFYLPCALFTNYHHVELKSFF